MFKLVPVRPIRKLNTLPKSQDIFDQFFDNFFNDEFYAPQNKIEKRWTGFSVDVLDEGDRYTIEADLPGFEKENVSIEYKDNHLTIEAKRQDLNEEKSDHFIRRERFVGSVKRSFYVDSIDPDQIKASFNNGVLKVTLDKLPLKDNVRSIVIE